MTKALPAPGTLTDIVWLQTSFIGDLVLTTAAMATAQATLPGVRQHVITTKTGAQIFAGVPALSSVLIFDKSGQSLLRSAKELRRQLAPMRTDGARRAVVLKAHMSPRSSLLARLLGLPVIGYEEAGLGFLADRRVARVAVWHEARRIALLLEPLGVSRRQLAAAQPCLAPLPLVAPSPAPAEPAWQSRILQATGPVIALAPGSVWGTKRWLPEGFAEVGRRLLRETDALLVFLGSPPERPVVDGILRTMQQALAADGGPLGDALAARWLNLSGTTSLDDLRRLFPHLRLLIANDSSPVHYAAAFGVPTLALFGATVPAMGFGPLAPGSCVLGVDLACRPCSDHGPQVCPLGHFRCMRELSADMVYGACRELLGSLQTLA